MMRLIAVGVLAIPLGFVVALWAFGVLAPPICQTVDLGPQVCYTADPTFGYIPDAASLARPGGMHPASGLPGRAGWRMPTPPSFPLLWVSATISVGVVLLVVGQLSGRLATAGPTTEHP
jgi:hypothetical protein